MWQNIFIQKKTPNHWKYYKKYVIRELFVDIQVHFPTKCKRQNDKIFPILLVNKLKWSSFLFSYFVRPRNIYKLSKTTVFPWTTIFSEKSFIKTIRTERLGRLLKISFYFFDNAFHMLDKHITIREIIIMILIMNIMIIIISRIK